MLTIPAASNGGRALPDSAVICSCFDVTKGDIKRSSISRLYQAQWQR
ncbi:hypothetical protein OK016_21015 [Vibrio chagasii]|nr:hypothetical protein [Vibrio chagasii]